MNLKTKFELKKIASCLCLIIAISMFFTGWVTVRQNEFTKELKAELRDLDDELEEVEEECEEMQEELEDLADELDVELDFSIEEMYKSAESLYKTIEDLALSPSEIVGFLPMMNKLGNMLEEFEDSDLPYYMMPMSGLEDVVESMEQVKGVFIVLMVLFVAAIALDVMYIVFHILNKKGAGFGAIPLHVIWFLIGGIPVLLVNVAMMEEMDMKVFRLMAAPYISLALVIASCVLWVYAMKDYTNLKIQEEQPEAKAFCMNCGQQISATATFCTNCGTKVE